jgi:hypothetical protein
MATRAKSNTTTDHQTIRNWAEERNARPACVRGTGGEEDVGMIRLDFPGYSGEESLEEISWDQWFEKFDESGLALVYQDATAGGERSNFNKLISREAAAGETPRRQRKSAQASQRVSKRRVVSQGRKQPSASAGGARRATAGTSRTTHAKAETRKGSSTRSKPQTKAASQKSAKQAPVTRGEKVVSIQSHKRKSTHGRGHRAA